MRHFELWLDESGDFIDERLKQQNRKRPSMIGGILVEKETADKIDFATIIDDQKFHATELTSQDKVDYILPILELMKVEYNAVEVFFENADFEDDGDNRQLYLRMMAEGLLQLMVRLNALYESVCLDVIIARRQDMSKSNSERIIQDDEYIYYLKSCMDKKIANHRILLNNKSQLNFSVKIANITEKLIIADFACNTRFTRDIPVLRAEKTRVNALYENAIILSMNEMTSENYFRCCLAVNAISDALVELFITKDKVNRLALIQELIDRMNSLSYRIIKSQLRQFAVEVTAIAAKEDDFEILEKMLKTIDKELLSNIHIQGIPYQYLEFNVLLCLADAYLREGDIIAAKLTLDRLRNTQLEMGNHLEDVFTYYQLIEKETLYYIDSFQYQKAADLMGTAETAFRNYMQATVDDDNMRMRFPELTSEYYGDALCMDIYALMFLQRSQPKLYSKLVELSDIALEQYPSHEGELERHRQYRSHIEMENGDCKKALQYLMQAKVYKWLEVNERNIMKFLDELCNSEIVVSCQYYLMYYLLIANRALEDDSELAELMWNTLQKQEKLLINATAIDADVSELDNSIELKKAQNMTTQINYHPLEIIYWKYANLQTVFQSDKAVENYTKATKLCERYSHYVTMRITGVGILGDMIAWLININENNMIKEVKGKFNKIVQELLAMELEPGTIEFINNLVDGISTENNNIVVYKNLAQKITY